jgi:hypothetical protein
MISSLRIMESEEVDHTNHSSKRTIIDVDQHNINDDPKKQKLEIFPLDSEIKYEEEVLHKYGDFQLICNKLRKIFIVSKYVLSLHYKFFDTYFESDVEKTFVVSDMIDQQIFIESLRNVRKVPKLFNLDYKDINCDDNLYEMVLIAAEYEWKFKTVDILIFDYEEHVRTLKTYNFDKCIKMIETLCKLSRIVKGKRKISIRKTLSHIFNRCKLHSEKGVADDRIEDIRKVNEKFIEYIYEPIIHNPNHPDAKFINDTILHSYFNSTDVMGV